MPQNITAKIIWLCLFLLAVILLVINPFLFQQKIDFIIFFVLSLSCIFILTIFLKFYSAKLLLIQSVGEHNQEEINIIAVENKKNQEYNLALKLKITRFDNLKK